jgi:hypothetical protein
MKFVLLALGLAVVAASIFADYKWRKWMSARRADRDQDRRS